MSPSEHDLRAALHDGEGKDIDVDRLMMNARARVAQRRVHLLSGTAIAAVVVAVGVGGALLANSGVGGGGSSNAGGARAPAMDRGANPAAPNPHAAASASAGAGGGLADAPAEAQAAIRCPKSAPRDLLPGGGSPGQFGASGPLFKKPVNSIVVCAYSAALQPVTQAGGQPAHFVLRDGLAQRVAASLESAPTRRPEQVCPDYRTADAQQIALIGVTSDGGPAGTVTTTVGVPACAVTVTNGTAIRYDWVPPDELQQRLRALAAPVVPKTTVGGTPTR